MKSIRSFEALFDLDQLQKIQDSFAAATGVAVILRDISGHPVTRPSNFRRLCTDIVPGSEKCLFQCMYAAKMTDNHHEPGPNTLPNQRACGVQPSFFMSAEGILPPDRWDRCGMQTRLSQPTVPKQPLRF